jgi:hypothetical protein
MYLNDRLEAIRAAEKARGECDDPDCACHDGEDLAEDSEPDYSTVTMTEVYDGEGFRPRFS